MRFTPGKDVSFLLEDGRHLTTRPFFFRIDHQWRVEFLANDGGRILCVDGDVEAFVIAGTCEPCHLETSPH